MILDSVPPNASLSAILHARAIASSPLRLTLDIVGGSVVAGAAYWVHSRGWITVACAGLCFALYGVWAFAERMLETGPELLPRSEELLLTGVRGVAALGGLAALLVLAFSLVSVLLGHWIS